MGSTESTGRSTNGTEEEEEKRTPKNDGGSMGSGTAVAIAAAGTVMAAWGISRMISSSSNSEDNKEKDDHLMKLKACGAESSSASFRNRESIQLQCKETGEKSIWSPPPPGRFKMNTDGGCTKKFIDEADGVERGRAGYAGILRNDRGMWVRGFQGSFNGLPTDSLTAEIHGIHKGLKLLDELQLKGSILENDNEEAVNWVDGQGDNKHKRKIINECWDTIEKSRKLKLKNGVLIKHIGRNANQCAHKLADIAAEKQGPYVEIIDLPPKITQLVDKDNKSLVNP